MMMIFITTMTMWGRRLGLNKVQDGLFTLHTACCGYGFLYPRPSTLAESAQQVTFLDLTRARAPHSVYYLHF